MSQVIKVNSDNFDDHINRQKGPFFLKFGSKTCGPCNSMIPILEKFSNDNPDLAVFDIDTQESPDLAEKFEIRSIPTMHFCEGREVIYTFNGSTALGNLQYVKDNINDPYMRENGVFDTKTEAKDHTFSIIIAAVVTIFILLFFFV